MKTTSKALLEMAKENLFLEQENKRLKAELQEIADNRRLENQTTLDNYLDYCGPDFLVERLVSGQRKEINRLKAALREIADIPLADQETDEAHRTARRALEGKE